MLRESATKSAQFDDYCSLGKETFSGASHQRVVYFYISSVLLSPFHSPVSIPYHIICVLVSVAI